jgi:hypothetical protein
MPIKLDKTLRREIVLDGQPYTVTISPRGVKLTAKGFRKGPELSWRALLDTAGRTGGPRHPRVSERAESSVVGE